MDSLCLKAGIIGITPQTNVAGDPRSNPSHISAAVGRPSTSVASSISAEKPSISGAAPQLRSTSPWGFPFRYPLRSLWPGGRSRYDAIAVDDAVSIEEKEEKQEGVTNGSNESWVLKILHVRSLWKEDGKMAVEEVVDEKNQLKNESDERNEYSGDDEDCGDGCKVDDDDDDEKDEKIEFDKYTFSKLLRRVSLPEARLYSKLSYLGNLAYSIPEIKPGNLLRKHGLRFVTSSLEKKAQLELKAETEKALEEVEKGEEQPLEAEERKEKSDVNQISANTAYKIASSAASYLHTRTMSILPIKTSKNGIDGDNCEEGDKIGGMMNADVASLMATTDSVTAVVAAKEEAKQAVADDLNSIRSSPCEWFICDDDQISTRFFVIQGSESLASWQANLLFEPIEFEGLEVLVHRGIYEAAKGIYEQMLPEVQAYLEHHGSRAKFRFTGHSLGGSLSLLVNLMLLIRNEVPFSSLLPVVTFGAPSIMCGGDRLLRKLGLPRNHLQAITMHRDIVPRAFSCNYPNRVAKLLKALNGNFRNHPCLNNQRLLYAPMGEFLILQPDDKMSPNHHLLPSGSGLYILTCPVLNASEAEKQLKAAQSAFLNSPHPLEILSDRSAYGSDGTIQRDHDMDSYLKCVKTVIRQDLNRMRKTKREQRRRVWWPLVGPRNTKSKSGGGVVAGRPVGAGIMAGQGQLNFVGVLQTGKETLRRFSRLVASQHMHLLVVFLLSARVLIVGAYSVIGFH